MSRSFIFLAALSTLTFAVPSWLHGQAVTFDAPAVVACQPAPSNDGSGQVVEVRVPVSMMKRSEDRIRISQLLVAIYWQGPAHPVVDFAPRTQMHSDIQGLISTQISKEKSLGAGVNLNGVMPNSVVHPPIPMPASSMACRSRIKRCRNRTYS